MKEIKICRKVYEIKDGDYVQYNGAYYLFCSGDNRTLKQEGFTAFKYVVLSKSAIKTINFDSMTKHEFEYITRWYF